MSDYDEEHFETYESETNHDKEDRYASRKERDEKKRRLEVRKAAAGEGQKYRMKMKHFVQFAFSKNKL
jgi:hypothetical protein